MKMNNIVDTVSGLDELWKHTKGSEEICIAVLDGMVDTSHHCFQGAQVQLLKSAVSNTDKDKPLFAASKHGTHVASLLFGSHSSQVKGIAPQCRGIFIPIFNQGKDGSIKPCSQIDLARAIEQAIANGAHIINVSGGQLSNSGEVESHLLSAINSCKKNNILLVAAAGNNGCECLHVPAALASTLAVGAMDDQGIPLPQSNWGEKYRTNGLLAPGYQILGAFPSGQIGEMSGTSFAAPIVSGIAALLLSLQIKQGQQPNPIKVRKCLLASATPCNPDDNENIDCRHFLAGVMNVTAATNLTLNGEKIKMSNEMEIPTKEMSISDDVVACMLEPSSIEAHSVVSDAHNIDTVETVQTPQILNEVGALVTPSAAQIEASSCGCSGGESSLVYALGTVGYDFVSLSRKDAFTQAIDPDGTSGKTPDNAADLLTYLLNNPWEAPSVIWTLNLNETTIYTIAPAAAYATVVYETLFNVLATENGLEIVEKNGIYSVSPDKNPGEHQNLGGVQSDMVAVPGIVAGSIALSTGQVVPQIIPQPGGISCWTVKGLVDIAVGSAKGLTPVEKSAYTDGLSSFLNRVYSELQNLGTLPADRALNCSATQTFQAASVLIVASKGGLNLSTIDVTKSSICRPGSECYDVDLTFFNPTNLNAACTVFRFTVDVSNVIPVSIGALRQWNIR